MKYDKCMAKHFDLKRFLGLCRLLFLENRKACLVSYGVLFILIIYLSLVGGAQMIVGFFPFAICAAGCLLTSGLFGKWSDTGHAASVLMVPASVTEKYLVGLVYGLFLFVPFFFIVYFFSAYVMLNVFHGPLTVGEILQGGKNTAGDSAVYYLNTVLVYLLVQPLAFYTAVRFRKFQFLYMVLIIVTLFVAYFYAQHLMMMNLTHMLAFNYNYFVVEGKLSYFSLRNSGTYPEIILKPWITYLNKGMWLFLAAGLYVAAYLRLKEREI